MQGTTLIRMGFTLPALLVAAVLISGCKNKPAPNHQPAATPHAAAPAAQPATATPPRPSGPIHFTEITARAGIHFVHNSGAFGKKYLPETMGSGVCFIDYDNDGWQDILFVNSMDWS